LTGVIHFFTKKTRLVPIRGVVPDPSENIQGCVFRTRCPKAGEICHMRPPALKEVAPDIPHGLLVCILLVYDLKPQTLKGGGHILGIIDRIFQG